MSVRYRGQQQAVNMLRVLEVIRKYADQPHWLLSESFIKDVNRVVLDGISRESYSAGEYRRHQNYLLDGSRRVVFTPPAPSECTLLVTELVETVNRWIEQRHISSPAALHPIRIAAIAHGRLIAIHPFAHGN